MAREIDFNFSLGATLASSFTGSFSAAQAQARGLSSALRQAERSSLGQAAQQRTRLQGMGADLRTAQTELEGLRERARASGGASGFMARQIAQAESRVSRLSGAIRAQGESYRGLIARMRSAGESTRGLRDDQRRLAEQMEHARRQQERLSATLATRQTESSRRAGLRGNMLDTAALGASVALPVKLAISAEDTFANLKKVLPNMDDAGVQQIFDDALVMSAKTGKSLEDVLSIMTAGAQAGLGKTREEMLSVTEQALQMSVAWGVPAEEAGKSLATWQASMKLTATDSRKLADTINVLSDNMNAEAGEINAITTRMGPLLKSMGFGTSGIAAFSATFKAAGAEVDVAGTALKNMTAVMAAGKGGLSKNQEGVYARLGIDPDTLARQMQEDAESATLMVLEALNNVAPEQRASLSMQLFGKESIAAIAPLLENLGLLKESLTLAQGTVDGSVFKEYQNRMSTTATAGARLTQNIRGLGIEIGSLLLPVTRKSFEIFSGWITRIRGLSKEFPGLAKAVVFGAGAIASLAVAGLVGAYVFSGLKSVWLASKTALLLLSGAQMQAALAQRTHTLTSLTWGNVLSGGRAGISRVVTALATFTGIQRGATLSTILFTTASSLCGMAAGVLTGVIKGVGLAFKLALGPVGILMAGLTLAVGLIIDNWDTVGPYFQTLWDGIVGIFTGAWDLIKGIVDNITGAAAWVGEKIDAVPVLGSAKRGLGKAADTVAGWFGSDTEEQAQPLTVQTVTEPENKKPLTAQFATETPKEEKGFWGSLNSEDEEEPYSQKPLTAQAVTAKKAEPAFASRTVTDAGTDKPSRVTRTLAEGVTQSTAPIATMATAPMATMATAPIATMASEARVPQRAMAAQLREISPTPQAGPNVTIPMSFQVQGLDMPTFQRRIQDCRADFEAIVKRVVGDMQHQQVRTAYAR